MANKGKDVDIEPPEDRPFKHKGENVGHITGRPRTDPEPPSRVSFWPV